MGAHGLCHAPLITLAPLLLHFSFLGTTAAVVCLNGGIHDGVKCICRPPYYGPHCEEGPLLPTEAPPAPAKSTAASGAAGTPSSSSPAVACQNGGTHDGVTCICRPPYYGPRCEEGPHPPTEAPPAPMKSTAAPAGTPSSSPAPCQNGGQSSGSHCVCPPGFWGTSCEFFDTKECQNGGIWAATACLCTHSFWGPKCEFVVNVIEVDTEVEAWLDMGVQVTNRHFTESLADSSSPDYKDFVQEFTQQVEEVYRKVPEYHNLTVLQLRPGSVKVHHRVHVMLPLSSRVSEALQNVSAQLLGLLSVAAQQQACEAPHTAPLCFEASSIQTLGSSIRVDEKDVCRGPVPVAFRPYFSGRPTEGGYECITQCAGGHPAALHCKHGQCQVPRRGPRCHCPDTDTSWFLGDQCSFHISKVGLSIGLPLTATLTVAIILAVVQARSPPGSSK